MLIAGRRVSVRTGQVIDRTEVEVKPTERKERESVPDWEDREDFMEVWGLSWALKA